MRSFGRFLVGVLLVGLLLFGMLWVGVGACVAPVHAVAPPGRAADDDGGSIPFPVPPAPDEIERLIDAGNVIFEFGTDRPSWVRSDVGGRNSAAGRYPLDGETKFEFDYRFSVRPTPVSAARSGDSATPADRRLSTSAGSGLVLASVRFGVTHRVWLRHRPSLDVFWDAPLLRHELDHVRVSSDPRIRASFLSGLREILDSDESTAGFGSGDQRSPEAPIARSVRARVRELFDTRVDLVRIRYRELDRVTDRGRTPVAADSKWGRFIADVRTRLGASTEKD